MVDKQIKVIDKTISNNISKFDDTERGLLSQNILSQLRNLVECISLKIYNDKKGTNLEPVYNNYVIAIKFIKGIGTFKFLWKFYNLLQISASHYTLDENASERLMLKYYEYLLKIKIFLHNEYKFDVFLNIDEFPIKLDKTTQEYYEKISEKINIPLFSKPIKDRYYIQKVKPFFVKNEVYYEVTFTQSHEQVNKFDRIIAFAKKEIISNYAVDLYLMKEFIEVLGEKMPVNIIQRWEVSIRPCELDNFAKILGIDIKMQSGHAEYKELMRFLTETQFSLKDYVIQEQRYYDFVKTKITQNNKTQFFEALDRCRDLLLKNQPGSNIISYLLHIMNNKIIKKQYSKVINYKLPNLYLDLKCIPFEQMPFTTSLVNHNPRIYDLFECLDYNNREHEFLGRFIQNNTEINGKLFTSLDELNKFENINALVKEYNGLIYRRTQSNRLIEIYNDKFFYMKGNKDNVIEIIKILKDLSIQNIDDYSNLVTNWLKETQYEIDCNDKKMFLIKMFEKSRVAMIYGAAGTGKSTIINHISNFFEKYKKLYLTQTNPAIDNLDRKVKALNSKFMTIAKFLSSKRIDTEFDILFIDESSIVSNNDVLAIMQKVSFSIVVFVGDIFQIECIRFGNWFEIVKEFLPKSSIFELTIPYRSENKNLLELWNKVRKIEDDISECIQRNGYSTKLDESIFGNYNDDEIILCLNYDGLYGINNINRFLQANNSRKATEWKGLIYKINDPILFNETKRFGGVIYNNLKGKILDIEEYDKQIEFTIEIDKEISKLDTTFYDFKLIENNGTKSTIKFEVEKYSSTDDDNVSDSSIIPFQVAYAVSIHKAQGLEYDSVKIVITDEVEEQITHSIFYTAITRAKEKLKIYWSPETENKILNELKLKNNRRDIELLKKIM